MHCLRAVSAYRLIDHTRSEDKREVLQNVDVNSRIKDYKIKAATARRKTEQNSFPNLRWDHKPRRTCETWKELQCQSWESSVGITTCYRLGGRGSNTGRGKIFFSASQRPDPFWDTTMGTGAFSSWLKRPGCEAHHSPASSAEAKNDGAIPPFSNVSSWCGV
jgi:hypothetical protein